MMFASLSTSYTLWPAYAPKPETFRKERMITAAADWLGVTPEQLLGSKRDRNHSHARFALMLVWRRLGWSTPVIGKRLGNRDHSTVISGIERARRLMETDEDFAGLVRRIEAVL